MTEICLSNHSENLFQGLIFTSIIALVAMVTNTVYHIDQISIIKFSLLQFTPAVHLPYLITIGC